MTSAPMVVTGGTGTLGGHVVPMLRAAGVPVRVLSRNPGPEREGVEYRAVDLRAGEGVEEALAGARTVLHLAGGTKGDDKLTANVVAAAERAGVKHLVYISVIGADTMPLGWFRTQRAAELAVTQSKVPWTMLRAAQFHDIVWMMAQKMGKMPVVPMPGGLRFQPVDSREVAERLVELALGEPAGLVADLAGPRVYPLGDLVRSYLTACGKRRPMLGMRMPGKAGKAYRAGTNLSLDGADMGKVTWEEFLAHKTK